VRGTQPLLMCREITGSGIYAYIVQCVYLYSSVSTSNNICRVLIWEINAEEEEQPNGR